MDEKRSEEVPATSNNKKKSCCFGKLMDEESSCFSEFTVSMNGVKLISGFSHYFLVCYL